jgi:DNA-binding LacI/PurR family transcriptional regulator
MATIEDVARLAGVSTATVSLITNPRGSGKYSFSKDTQEKVWKAVRLLNYRPSRIAQGLSSRKTNVIGLILPTIRDPFFPAIAAAMESELREHGYQLLLSHSSGSDETEKSTIKELESWSVAGIVAVPAQETGDPRTFWELHDSGVAFVLVDRRFEGTPFPSVVTDDAAAASEATAHLIKLGHRDIVMMLGRTELYSVKQRLQGYSKAMIEHDLVPRTVVTTSHDESTEGAYSTSLSFFRSDKRPTAVFCVSDPVAIGVMRAAFELGLMIPDDLAVVGFGDLPYVDMFRVPLTTVSQPKAEIGARAARMIIEQLSNPDSDNSPTQVTLPCKLVVRESCGKSSELASKNPPQSPLHKGGSL